MNYTLEETHSRTWHGTIESLAVSLHDDPLYRWFVPQDHLRDRWVYVVMQASAILCKEGGRNYSILDAAGSPVGGACGFRFQTYHIPFFKSLRFIGSMVLKPHPFLPHPRMILPGLAYNNAMEKSHFKEAHWHLYALGVRPDMQKKGLGGRLLRTFIGLANEDHMPLYLETNKESNIAFYEKHGMELLNKVEVSGNAPPFWRMLYHPQIPSNHPEPAE